jgi:hypothetical protein
MIRRFRRQVHREPQGGPQGLSTQEPSRVLQRFPESAEEQDSPEAKYSG